MFRREKHTFNGKLLGCYYEIEGGRRLYLAHRSTKHIHQSNNAWCLDVSLLEKLRTRGIWAVGVICRIAGKKMVWLTHIEDFFDSPHSFGQTNVGRQRGLPLSRFRIDPAKSEKVIATAIRIGR